MECLNDLVSYQKKVLILAPHPDDESIWCGGLILSHPDQCMVIILTDGQHGGENGEEQKTILIRKAEFEKAMQLAGVTSFKQLSAVDGHLSEVDASFLPSLEGYDIIICPSPWDSHPDHAAVWNLIMQKAQPYQKILFYDGWSALARPTHYIELSEELMRRKLELIEVYQSQLRYVNYDERAKSLASFRGLVIYPVMKYAEVYEEFKN